MNRATNKAAAELLSRHVVSQLRPLLSGQINPSKTRCGIKALVGVLHRECVSCCGSSASPEKLASMEPLQDALGLLTAALAQSPLNREMALRAYHLLKAIADRVDSN